MSTRDDDLIRDILARVMALSEDFSQAQALQLEEQIRHDWNGETYRVAKRAVPKRGVRYSDDVKKAAVADVERGMPPPEAARKHGIGRAWIYRLLKDE